jgi:hypothetical protein
VERIIRQAIKAGSNRDFNDHDDLNDYQDDEFIKLIEEDH